MGRQSVNQAQPVGCVMEESQQNPVQERRRERCAVAFISGILTCLLVAPVAYLLLKPVENQLGPTSSALVGGVQWGVKSGCIVGIEFYALTRVRPQAKHRLVEAGIAAFLAVFAQSWTF